MTIACPVDCPFHAFDNQSRSPNEGAAQQEATLGKNRRYANKMRTSDKQPPSARCTVCGEPRLV